MGRLLDQTALVFKAIPQAPDNVSVGLTNTPVVAADADRAYVDVTLAVISAGNCFLAIGQGAQVDKGQVLQEGVAIRVFGTQSVNAICDTDTSATVIFQSYDAAPETGS